MVIAITSAKTYRLEAGAHRQAMRAFSLGSLAIDHANSPPGYVFRTEQ